MCYFIHCVRSEVVQQGTEGQAIPPGGGEVCDFHPTVVLGDLSTPDQQRLASIGFPTQNWTWDWTRLGAERKRWYGVGEMDSGRKKKKSNF